VHVSLNHKIPVKINMNQKSHLILRNA